MTFFCRARILAVIVALIGLAASVSRPFQPSPLSAAEPGASPWPEKTFREHAYFAPVEGLPPDLPTRGSRLDGSDAYRGEFVSGWFAPHARVTLLVAGFPRLAGNHLALEVRRPQNADEEIPFAAVNPGDSWQPWTVSLPRDATAFRVQAVDGSSDFESWLAVTAPFAPPLRVFVLSATARILLAFVVQGLMLLALGWSLAHWIALAPWPWCRGKLTPLLAAGAVALLGYVAFWLYFMHPLAGRGFSWLLAAGSAATLLGRRPVVGNNFAPPALAATIGLFYLALLLLPEPARFSEAAAHRFVPGLPSDNDIPRAFAERLWHGESPRHLWGDWLSSDRPPLQTGWVLLNWPVTAGLGFDADIIAGTGGVCFQLLWVFALGAFARFLGANARQAAALTSAVAFTGVLLLFSVFVWPKLGAAALVIAAFLIWFDEPDDQAPRLRFALGGVCAALGWLAHGGVAFSLLGLAPLALALRRRIPLRSWWPALAAFALLAAPWLAYQHWYEPPGNRLIKWHLAGVLDIDPRGAGEALRDSYQRIGLAGALHNRWTNVRMQFGGNWTLLSRVFTQPIKPTLRFDEFYYGVHGLSLWVLAAAIPLLWWRRRPPPSPAAWLAFAWLVLGLMLWLGLMFLPDSASIHQGTLVTQLLALLLLAWTALRCDRRVFLALAAAQAAWFVLLWTSPGGQPLQPGPLALAVASGGALAWTIWRGMRKPAEAGAQGRS